MEIGPAACTGRKILVVQPEEKEPSLVNQGINRLCRNGLKGDFIALLGHLTIEIADIFVGQSFGESEPEGRPVWSLRNAVFEKVNQAVAEIQIKRLPFLVLSGFVVLHQISRWRVACGIGLGQDDLWQHLVGTGEIFINHLAIGIPVFCGDV